MSRNMIDFGFTKTRPMELGYGKKRSLAARARAAVGGVVSSVTKSMSMGGVSGVMDSSETRTSNKAWTRGTARGDSEGGYRGG